MLDQKTWLTVSEAAKLLHLSEIRVRQFMQTGRLNAVKFGHVWAVDRKSLEKFAKIKRQPGRPWHVRDN